MTTYLVFIEDAFGDTVDILYYHGFCAPADVRAEGAWPCPEALDYTVHCEVCGERVKEVPLTSHGLWFTCERGWEAMEHLTEWERREAIEGGFVADKYGRDWGAREIDEVCMECGQPDNCGDCTHERLSDHQAASLGAILPYVAEAGG